MMIMTMMQRIMIMMQVMKVLQRQAMFKIRLFDEHYRKYITNHEF